VTLLERVNKFLDKNVEFSTLMDTIEALVTLGEKLVKENGAMAEKHAEKDIALKELMEIMEGQRNEIELYKLQESMLLERLKKQTLEIKEMKNDRRLTRFYAMAEENLKLAEENSRLRNA